MLRTLAAAICLLLAAGCSEVSDEFEASSYQGGSFRISPATAAAGLSRVVEITGYGTDWRPGEVSLDFGEGVDVLSVSVVSRVRIEASVLPRDDAPLGVRDVVVTWDDRRLTRLQAFGVEAGAISMSPAGARLGETVRVQVIGHRTNFRGNLTSVSLGDGIRVDDVRVESAGLLSFAAHVAPDAAVGGHDLVAHNAGTDVVSLRDAFVVDRTSRFLRIVPNEAWQGAVLTAVIGILVGFLVVLAITASFSFTIGTVPSWRSSAVVSRICAIVFGSAMSSSVTRT